jgi:O-antigen ligase
MSFIIATGVASTVPFAVGLFRQTRVFGLLLAVMIAGVVCGPFLFSASGVSIDRLLLLAAAFGFLSAVIKGEQPVPSLRAMDYPLLLFTGWMLYRSLPTLADAPEYEPISRWIFFLAVPSMCYLLARFTTASAKDFRLLSSALVVLGCYLAATGVFEVAGLHSLVFPKYIVDPEEWEFFGRARGPLMNPVGNGIVLVTAFAVALMRTHENDRVWGTLSWFAAGLIGVGIIATLTRSVWLSAGLVFFLYIWVYRRNLVAPMIMFGLGSGLLITTAGSGIDVLNIKRDKNLSAADAAKSVELRPVLAIVAMDMAKDRPLIGHGYAGYKATSQPYLANRNHDAALEGVRPYVQHNFVLSLLVDGGLVAIGLLGCWVYFAWRSAWTLGGTNRDWDRDFKTLGFTALACFTAFGINGMFHDTTIIPMMVQFVLFLAGLVLGLIYRKADEAERTQRADPSDWTVKRWSLNGLRCRLRELCGFSN